MPPKVFVVLALGICTMVASSGRAAAQTRVSASYDPLLHELTENSSLGGHGDVARRIGSIAALGEIGVSHFDQATVITVAPGVRYRLAAPATSKFQPAVQAVAGLWHCAACEVNELFLQPGVLVDYARSSALTLRFQFDVRRIFFDFGGETAERIGVGVVWTIK
jgi:hypothetical protein